ncbi:hypothetical protein KUTeg_012431 [Tegillarca granosa]|uniref:PH domain-containing protein n=1 Tax=Tegillarca granosa TaxID=220873 RepID=A0ABQ9EZI7_TEGGR|nr:hypothetical protein KUTeg_012431 [Tegillarca granosa]
MAERKFRQRIQKIGAAAKVREEVAQQMRENIILQRPPSVDPVDYETYVTKNKTILHNDPQREMLVFPHDDIVNPPPTLAKKLRTLYSTVPKSAEHEATSLLVQECIKSYTDCCKKIKFKYSLYSGGYLSLPSLKNAEPLPHQVFEIDTEADEKEEEALSKSNVTSITKTGWLYKGPDSGKENIMSFTRQFKRRYFVLKQQSDFTYILEFYKDERKFEAKGSLFLDVAKEVVKSTKKGKYCFEVHVHDRAPYVFAAESETDMTEWIQILNKFLNISYFSKETSTPDKMEGKADNSMHPELQKVSEGKADNSMHPELQKVSEGKADNSMHPELQKVSEGKTDNSMHPELQKVSEGKTDNSMHPELQKVSEGKADNSMHPELQKVSEGKADNSMHPELQKVSEGKADNSMHPELQKVSEGKADNSMHPELQKVSEGKADNSMHPELQKVSEGKTDNSMHPELQKVSEGKADNSMHPELQKVSEGKTDNSMHPELQKVSEGKTDNSMHPELQKVSEGKTDNSMHPELQKVSEGKADNSMHPELQKVSEGKADNSMHPELQKVSEGKADNSMHPELQKVSESKADNSMHPELQKVSEGKTDNSMHPELQKVSEGKADNSMHPELQKVSEGKTDNSMHPELQKVSEGKADNSMHPELQKVSEGKADNSMHPELQKVSEGKADNSMHPELQKVSESKADNSMHPELQKVSESKADNSMHPELQKVSEGKTDNSMHPELQKVSEGKADNSMHPELQKVSEGKTDNSMHPELQKVSEGKADNSMHPELQKKFAIDEDIDSSDDEEICVFPREFGERFMLQLHDFKMKLQVDLSEEKIANKCCNPEPFFLTFALYDAKEGRKISEDFHMDPNEPEIRSMIPPEVLHASDKLHTVEGRDTAPQLNGLKDSWILSPNRQIEKILQGPMLQALEPYSKADSSKSGSKLISPSQGPAELPIYRHDGTKLSTADIIKHLQDFRKPDKQSKLQEIPDPPPDPPALEIEEFVGDKGSLCDTFDSYINNIYIYPVSLKYEHQKSFAKARNIACCIEIKDSDEDGSLPLKRIYGRPEVGVYTTVASTTVLHHVTSPDFTEEVKISLPTQIHDRHHVLFRFYHVSCEGSKSSLRSSSSSGKKKDTIETPLLSENTPYQWLLTYPRVICHMMSTVKEEAGGPEIKWVDGGKHLFKVNSFLRSTIYTKEQHLHNFFYHCQRIENSPVNDLESVNRLKV